MRTHECHIPESTLESFAELVSAQLGLHFPRERWPDLLRGVESACPELGFPGSAVCIEHLLRSPPAESQAEVLATHLTIGETYFFREPKSFESLAEHILPELLERAQRESRPLRIWSAGCATGEEAYSLAILLHERFPGVHSRPPAILGTDINPGFLRKARAGVYTAWSFRGTPEWVRKGYFVEADGRFEILPSLRKLVTFAYLNLARDAYPSTLNNTNAMDLVLCRNVLMYFTPAVAGQVVRRLENAIVPGGWLGLSPCDVSHVSSEYLSRIRKTGIGFLRKQEPKPALAPNPSLPENGSATRERFSKPARRARQAPTSHLVPKPGLQKLKSAAEMYREGRYAEAGTLLAAYLEAFPRDVTALQLFARVRANEGQLAAALELCRRALEINRLNPSLHLLRATILQEQGNLAEAIAGFRRVLYLDPEHVVARYALGNLQLERGAVQEAQRQFAEALQILSGWPDDSMVPESEGLTAGRLRGIIEASTRSEVAR